MIRTVEITIEDGYEIEGNSIEEIEAEARKEAEERYTGNAHIEVNVIDDE